MHQSCGSPAPIVNWGWELCWGKEWSTSMNYWQSCIKSSRGIIFFVVWWKQRLAGQTEDWQAKLSALIPPYRKVETLKGNVVFVMTFLLWIVHYCLPWCVFPLFFLLFCSTWQTNFPSGTAALMSLDIMSCNDWTRILHKQIWLLESLTRAWKKTVVMGNSPLTGVFFYFIIFFSVQMSLEVTVFLSSTEQSMASPFMPDS